MNFSKSVPESRLLPRRPVLHRSEMSLRTPHAALDDFLEAPTQRCKMQIHTVLDEEIALNENARRQDAHDADQLVKCAPL
jgi:hypothetical protein